MGRSAKNVDNVEKCKNRKKSKKLLTFSQICIILTYVIEAWLSLVERCVRDAEVASSNLVASTYTNTRPVGQAVKTTPSHGVNPVRFPDRSLGCCILQQHFFKGASVAQLVEQRIRNAWVAGSSPAGA